MLRPKALLLVTRALAARCAPLLLLSAAACQTQPAQLDASAGVAKASAHVEPTAPPSLAAPPPLAAHPSASASAVAPPERPRATGRVLVRTFHSSALDVDKGYLIYLPAGYDAGSKKLPVVYLLHGYGGDEGNWVKVGHLPEAADGLGLQAIVVMPDGDDSFYSNWTTPLPWEECQDHRPSSFGHTEPAATYCVKSPRYEDYLVKDLVRHVEATYRAAPDRRARAIIGASMGGLGALMLAMRHPDVFAVAGSHSGVVSPLYAGPHPYVEGKAELSPSPVLAGKEFPDDLRAQATQVFGADLANWQAHDPSALAAKLKDGDLALYLDCGAQDGYKLADQARYLHDVLVKANVNHTFTLVPGGHSFALWKDRLPESLAFAAAEFRKGGY